jgi:RNA-binding motif X-linked protein 2
MYIISHTDQVGICFFRFGEIVDINMPRDRETHKAKGFSFLMYEDQRSTVLAVDNMNGARVLGRTVRVDHVRSYKHPDKTNAEGERVEAEEPTYNAMPPLIGGDGESSEAGLDSRQGCDSDNRLQPR